MAKEEAKKTKSLNPRPEPPIKNAEMKSTKKEKIIQHPEG
jgi:hypothetical protein